MDTVIKAQYATASFSNEETIKKSNGCGCYYCCKHFPPSEIKTWIKESRGRTAQCPYCDVDSVIGDATGLPVDIASLEIAHKELF